MAQRTRRVFAPEYKAEAVRLAHTGHGNIAATARDLGIDVTTLRDWLRRASAKKPDSSSLSPSETQVLSARTRRSSNRATSLLRLADVTVGKNQTAIGAFFHRLAARAGKAKAVTEAARKIAALFYKTLRYGAPYKDPGADYYEERFHRRTLEILRRRADALGFKLVESEPGRGGSFLGKRSRSRWPMSGGEERLVTCR